MPDHPPQAHRFRQDSGGGEPLRPAPRVFWGLALYCIGAVALTSASVWMRGAPKAEPDFHLRSLVSQFRMAEGPAIIAAAASGEAPEETLDSAVIPQIGREAAALARVATRPDIVEQAAAIWLLAGGPDTLSATGTRAFDHDAALQALLPKPNDRAALSDLLIALAQDRSPTPAQLKALSRAPIIPWIRSRLLARVAHPEGPLDLAGPHAHGELPFLTRAFGLLSVYSTAFLVGLVLMVVVWFKRARLPHRLKDHPHVIWGPEPWVGWLLALAWFAASYTAGTFSALLGGAGGLSGALTGLAIQTGSGALVIWMVVQVSDTRAAPAIAGLRMGLGAFENRLWEPLLWALGGWLAAFPLVFGVGLLQQLAGVEPYLVSNPILPDLLSDDAPTLQLVLVISAVALAPLFEELVFRGILFRTLRQQLGPLLGALLSSALFALIHFDPGTMLPLFVLALVLCFVTERSGALLPAMLIHGAWNGGSLLLTSTLYGG